MAATIDGNVVPDALVGRGEYDFPRGKIIRYDGQGLAVREPFRHLVWTFKTLSAAELTFWNTTVLGGAESKTCTGTLILKDPTVGGAEVAFSTCVVDAPDQGDIPVGGILRDVTINIRNIQ